MRTAGDALPARAPPARDAAAEEDAFSPAGAAVARVRKLPAARGDAAAKRRRGRARPADLLRAMPARPIDGRQVGRARYARMPPHDGDALGLASALAGVARARAAVPPGLASPLLAARRHLGLQPAE